jgi:hypothetical protein
VWTDYFVAAGATAAVAAAAGGAFAALRYGRRATVVVAASVSREGGATLVAARVSVRATGVFRLRIREDRPCTITVTEVWSLPDGLIDGRNWEAGGLFEAKFVEPGETLWTTELVKVAEPEEGMVGWRVEVNVAVARWMLRAPWTRGVAERDWDDRVFVSRPAVH